MATSLRRRARPAGVQGPQVTLAFLALAMVRVLMLPMRCPERAGHAFRQPFRKWPARPLTAPTTAVTPNDQSSARVLRRDERRVPRELPESDAVVQPARLGMPWRTQAGDRHNEWPRPPAPAAYRAEASPSQSQAPVVRMRPQPARTQRPCSLCRAT